MVRAERGPHVTHTLFDVGVTGTVLAHNLRALRIPAQEIDHVVISHGHPDHFGGIFGLLDALEAPMPIATHPDAFLPRYAVMGDGRTAPDYNQAFQLEALYRSGGRPIFNRGAMDLGWGVFTTGEIAREADFEGPPKEQPQGSAGLWQVAQDGTWVPDQVMDEGLIVLTGCAHAGVINTMRQARRLAGDKPIRAVMGGFHLGFPTTPQETWRRP